MTEKDHKGKKPMTREEALMVLRWAIEFDSICTDIMGDEADFGETEDDEQSDEHGQE